MLRLSLIYTTAALAAGRAPSPPGEPVQRELAAMGTYLSLSVEAETRELALAASEAAARAVEAAERRLSTWSRDSELARLNAAPVGVEVTLSPELERDLTLAARWFAATQGAFDPALGGWVRAWDLRGAGRVASRDEIEAARVPGGYAALELRPGIAIRRHTGLIVEEGGFGKGVALDDALAAARASGATRARVDLGGQLAVIGRAERVVLAHPRHRDRPVLELELPSGSLATSGNAERGLVADGVSIGHLLDPRTGAPARDFGSLSVWCSSAADADCLSKLFVLGPEGALRWAAEHPGVELLVLEFAPHALDPDALRARATPALAARARPLVDGLAVEPVPPERSVVPARSGVATSSPSIPPEPR